MNRTTERQRGGFSLIEMAVTISIIALLTVLLFPAIKTVQKKADLIRCTSNLRQCFTAFCNYAVENDGYLPDVGNNGTYWPTTLVPYYSNQPATYQGLSKAPLIQKCPTQARNIREAFGKDYPGNYGMNFTLGICTANNVTRRQKLTALPVPSNTLLLTEGNYNVNSSICVITGYDLTQSATNKKTGSYFGGVHTGANNILWADGHITIWKDVQTLPPPGGKYGTDLDLNFSPGIKFQ